MTCFSVAPCFATFLLWHAQKLEIFGQESDLLLLLFHFFFFFFIFCTFPISPFHIFLVIDHLLGLPPVQKILRKHHQEGQFLRWSSHVQLKAILLWIFSSNSEHFCGYFRLNWADHSDLDVISCCRTWVQMMPILVKGNDVRSEKKVNAHHSWHRSQWVTVSKDFTLPTTLMTG